MLHEFLKANQTDILALSEENTKSLAGDRKTSELLQKGLPLFYRQLILILEKKMAGQPSKELLEGAAQHGREFLNLGYSLSHVVHSYGAMCQAITEVATMKNANISPLEFNILNGCLDVAIAAAVSEFQFRSNANHEARENKNLGFLAHELRNSLSAVAVAHQMIKGGIVGVGGSTAAVLEANIVRMGSLIDRSLSEVRMRVDSDIYIENFRLADLFDLIVPTANFDAGKRNQKLIVEIDGEIELQTDRQFILSAVSNITQNALKYSKKGSTIWLRGKLVNDRVLIEVEDRCGGLKDDKINSLFEPYVQKNEDRSGLGLGLSITQRAVHLCQGTISVKNHPGLGCSFTIDIPQILQESPSNKAAVPGIDSIQPDFKKK
jgi:signal transduction histidine kinase